MQQNLAQSTILARTTLCIAVGATLLTRLSAVPTAVASPAIAREVSPRGDRRNEVNIGFIVGSEDVGTSKRFADGVQIDVGRRFGDLAILGEYNYLAVGRSYESNGTMSRVGLVGRYSLLRTQRDPLRGYRRGPLSGDFWIEAGAGVQRITWNEGGRLTRPDVVLGFGWQFNGVLGPKSEKPRLFGPFVAFRAHLTRAPLPASDVMPTCGGPCDVATRPSRNDVGLFFHFGINWAR